MPDIHALPTPQRLLQTVLDKHPSLKHLLENSRREGRTGAVRTVDCRHAAAVSVAEK